MKPMYHAESSARRFGGAAEDYLPIHDFMDSSKGAIADNRHRALTHNAWFISVVIERVFGTSLTNSNGREVSTREIAEQHVLEDYGGRFIPSAQDFLQEIEFKDWMQNGRGVPPSFAKIEARKTRKLLNGVSKTDGRRAAELVRAEDEIGCEPTAAHQEPLQPT